MMPRSSNRAYIEANVVESPVMRCCKLVTTIAFWIVFSVGIGLIVAGIGFIAAIFFVTHSEVYNEVTKYFYTYIMPILFGWLFFLALCGIVVHLWISDPIRKARNDLRRCCRNLRRTVHLIRLPAFFTRYLRGHDPLREVEISTIPDRRRQPFASYNADGDACTVQIESPSPEPQQPLRSGSPVLATESTFELADSHPHTS